MEYQSTQYKAGHMTKDMETVTIQKGDKEQTIVPTINHNYNGQRDKGPKEGGTQETMEGLRNPGIPLQFE